MRVSVRELLSRSDNDPTHKTVILTNFKGQPLLKAALFAFLLTRGNFLADALRDDFFLNSPFVVAVVTVFGSLIWLLVAAAVAGETAARDVQTRMHPLTYTSPIRKAEYLGGRFLAAFLLNAGELSRGHTPRTRCSLHT